MVSAKNAHAAALGKLGGQARLKKTTAEQRRAWARQGGMARASCHSKKELSKWARRGGRPRQKKR
jgi:hypothetical protein